jgi:hypothetical protein
MLISVSWYAESLVIFQGSYGIIHDVDSSEHGRVPERKLRLPSASVSFSLYIGNGVVLSSGSCIIFVHLKTPRLRIRS